MNNIEKEFLVGSYDLHPDPQFNFQLNRCITWGGGDPEEIKEAAVKITDVQTWTSQLIAIGEKALSEKRVKNAIAYFRMAEFFMFDHDPNKIRVYEKAVNLFNDFYADTIKKYNVRMDNIPYETGFLPVWSAIPDDGKYEDVIVMHGGFDSYKEEFLLPIIYLKQNGFAVYFFEGPGQSEVIRKHKIPFTEKWERPTGVVLDYYGLDDVTIVGYSLGAILSPRAAAFDKRIKRVIAESIFPSFFDILIATRTPKIQKLLRIFMNLKARKLINKVAEKQMRSDIMAKWGFSHGMFTFRVDTPFEYLTRIQAMNMANFADKITQDFLLVGSQKDHYIAVDFYKDELDLLKNVRSLTYRLFTDAEGAGNHCNCSNSRLALDFIMSWIRTTKAGYEIK